MTGETSTFVTSMRLTPDTVKKYCRGDFRVTEENDPDVIIGRSLREVTPGTPLEQADRVYNYLAAFHGGANSRNLKSFCPAMFKGPRPENPPPPPRPAVVHYDPPPPKVAIPEPPPVPKPPPETRQVYSSVLDVVKPGVQRVRLYCSEAVAKTANLTVSSDCTVRLIGRRYEPVTETIHFNRSTRGRLRYFYDRQEPKIEHKSQFWLTDSREADTPVFDRQSGAFVSMSEVTGSMIVTYSPGFSLYEVTYRVGKSLVSAEHFNRMRDAWLKGDINTVSIVPVRVYAQSKWHATQASFQRKFWPTGTAQLSFNKGSQYTEQPGTRVSETVRVYSATDPTVFVDVQRDKYVEMKNSVTGEPFIMRLY